MNTKVLWLMNALSMNSYNCGYICVCVFLCCFYQPNTNKVLPMGDLVNTLWITF